TANITFIAAEKDNVLRVPNAAMRFRPTPEIFTALGVPVPTVVRDAADHPRAGAISGGGAGTHTGGGAGARPAGTGGPGAGGGRGRPGGRGDAPTDRRSVWLLRDGKPQTVALRVGLSDGNLTELIEGDLHEGDALIVDAAATEAQPAAAPAAPGGMRRLF
ncbi:MAG TPA: hypothetical protein VLA79_03235, partial [Polyangia bacterium]|nr:hypothetical protein [Polyangia bacterium]